METKNPDGRTLEQVCVGGGFHFRIILQGINYCKLSMNGRKDKDIQCDYIGKKDHNKIKTCESPDYLN